MSGLINKVKEAVHSDKKDNAATDNPHSSNAGPHGSNMANKADPRVDSDRDNLHSGTTGAGYGSGTTGTTGAGYGSGTTGTTGAGYGTGTTGTTGAGYDDPRSSNQGPHSSNLANKADPRIDSDMDGSRNMGARQTGQTGGLGSSTAGTGYGSTTTGTTGGYGSSTTGAGLDDPRSTNQGPHSSNLANKADPRIDSDRDGSRNMGAAGNTGYGSTGTTGAGYGGTGATGTTGAGYGNDNFSATPGSGNTNKTAGPHNSDLLNKVDPRVDSDMDGSKTYGGNATHR